DLRQVAAGDTCKNCGTSLEIKKTIEVGHIFKLGYKYSDSMGLKVLNADGAEVTVIMGSYGIGLERILSAAVEQHHDKDGMALPPSIAPFNVVVTPVNISDAAQKQAAEEIYRRCLALGLDALLDDRDERAGVKFKDAELIGIPYRITVGKKLAQGLVEVVERRGKVSRDVPAGEAAAAIPRS
ncbi:MAG: His/Gly/Thr/Pro-type tRNA ligase C-terminal domain-containing protein, partial [Acidobacteriota bacterium]|nr:His/Gly/Thr/Pro-type tRNA ligase C-terminal domain-containing protein [Acidobacteriota bacterium]